MLFFEILFIELGNKNKIFHFCCIHCDLIGYCSRVKVIFFKKKDLHNKNFYSFIIL